MCQKLKTRALKPSDAALLRQAMLRTARWREDEPTTTLEEIFERMPSLSRYVDEFGRFGDAGFVAEEDGQTVGVVWSRLFTVEAPGLGFFDESTPELGIAVWSGNRRKGIGSALISEIIRQVTTDGFSRLSLAVSVHNERALRLYERHGFKEFARQDPMLSLVLDIIK